MSSCWRRDSAVFTTMSRSVLDWNVPPRPMSSTSPSIERASSRIASSAVCARSRWRCSSATSRSWATQPPLPVLIREPRTDESMGPAATLPTRVVARLTMQSCPRCSTKSPFLRACRGERVERVPVWFMRQAGRSLPEYRALRGEGSILEAIADPALACEVTLQPVRRYGVDAAILFSDIVVPLHAIGFGVDVVPGRGPVVEHPVRTAADLARLRPLEEDDVAHVAETVRLATQGARGERHAAHRLRGRTVHGRELRGGGRPDAHLRAGQGPRARRPHALRGAHATAWRTSRSRSRAHRSAPGRRRSSSSTPGRGRSRRASTSASRCRRRAR